MIRQLRASSDPQWNVQPGHMTALRDRTSRVLSSGTVCATESESDSKKEKDEEEEEA